MCKITNILIDQPLHKSDKKQTIFIFNCGLSELITIREWVNNYENEEKVMCIFYEGIGKYSISFIGDSQEELAAEFRLLFG